MIALAFALEFESAGFAARHDRRLRVHTWVFGAMGERAAEALRRKLVDCRPALVVSAGFAGGLQPQLSVGDLLVGRNYSDERLVSQLTLGDGWRVGDVVTAPRLVHSAAAKERLGTETGALATDLETAHLAAVCAAAGVPMLGIRCVSDAVDENLPVPPETLLAPGTGRPDPTGLFKYLLANPAKVAPFSRLLRNARKAQRSLARGLEGLLPQLLQLV